MFPQSFSCLAMNPIKKYLAALKHVTVALVVVVGVIAALHFPYDVDAPPTGQGEAAAQKYYTDAFQKPTPTTTETSAYETEYIRIARHVAEETRIAEQVGAFVKRFELADRAVLEIGSGEGLLQDLAANYTGLDISPSVARFYHKKFVLGSATALPFPDDNFDGIWSVAVFEHVPNPEQAFSEARRVIRDKGVLFLLPAWNCNSWAADGYEVRSYSDFDLLG